MSPLRPSAAVPQLRTAPTDLLARLRAIDPTADLVYAGDGRWWLGYVPPSDTPLYATKVAEGRAMLAGMRALDGLRGGKGRAARAVLNALCRLQGFVWMHEFAIQGEPDARVLHHLEEVTWVAANRADAAWAAFEYEASGAAELDRKRARATEGARLLARDAHRHAFRKPVSITVPA